MRHLLCLISYIVWVIYTLNTYTVFLDTSVEGFQENGGSDLIFILKVEILENVMLSLKCSLPPSGFYFTPLSMAVKRKPCILGAPSCAP